MKRNRQTPGFTLIELLMVIAIIGILAGILIPTVGLVRERINIATSQARIAQYLSAIQAFKGEYSYYPFSDLLDDKGQLDLSNPGNSEAFYETLMARDIDDPSAVVPAQGNRRTIQFYTFTPDELADGSNAKVTTNTIIDSFGNNRIVIVFDHDSDGEITVPDPYGASADTKDIRSVLSAHVLANEDLDSPAYYLYQ